VHGAGATLAVIAAFLGAGEMQMFSQGIEQRGARIDFQRLLLAVDLEREFARGGRRRGCSGSAADNGTVAAVAEIAPAINTLRRDILISL